MMNQTTQNRSGSESGTAKELRSDAEQVGRSAKDRVHNEIDARKDTAAQQAQSLSSAIDRTAGGLGDDAPDWLRSALQQGAQQIQKFADTLEQKDSRQIFNEVSSFARERPGVFLAGCAAAGFAAARIFKAGGDQPAETDQWQAQSAPTGTNAGFGTPGNQPTPPASTRGEFV